MAQNKVDQPIHFTGVFEHRQLILTQNIVFSRDRNAANISLPHQRIGVMSVADKHISESLAQYPRACEFTRRYLQRIATAHHGNRASKGVNARRKLPAANRVKEGVMKMDPLNKLAQVYLSHFTDYKRVETLTELNFFTVK